MLSLVRRQCRRLALYLQLEHESLQSTVAEKNLPDSSISLESEPLGNGTVLLGSLSKLDLGLERLLGLKLATAQIFQQHERHQQAHIRAFATYRSVHTGIFIRSRMCLQSRF